MLCKSDKPSLLLLPCLPKYSGLLLTPCISLGSLSLLTTRIPLHHRFLILGYGHSYDAMDTLFFGVTSQLISCKPAGTEHHGADPSRSPTAILGGA